jgi:hypothetical protein
LVQSQFPSVKFNSYWWSPNFHCWHGHRYCLNQDLTSKRPNKWQDFWTPKDLRTKNLPQVFWTNHFHFPAAIWSGVFYWGCQGGLLTWRTFHPRVIIISCMNTAIFWGYIPFWSGQS